LPSFLGQKPPVPTRFGLAAGQATTAPDA
jgi:hypothetical protein